MAKWEDIMTTGKIFGTGPKTPRANWLRAIGGGLLALAAALRG